METIWETEREETGSEEKYSNMRKDIREFFKKLTTKGKLPKGIRVGVGRNGRRRIAPANSVGGLFQEKDPSCQPPL